MKTNSRKSGMNFSQSIYISVVQFDLVFLFYNCLRKNSPTGVNVYKNKNTKFSYTVYFLKYLKIYI